MDGYGSNKYFRDGVGYKAGSFNLDYYQKYSGLSLSEFYTVAQNPMREND